jgi:hypothetical protein
MSDCYFFWEGPGWYSPRQNRVVRNEYYYHRLHVYRPPDSSLPESDWALNEAVERGLGDPHRYDHIPAWAAPVEGWEET